MDPKSWEQLAIVLVALLPGFVFRVTYTRLRGSTEAEKPISSRLFGLIAITFAFDVAYVWIFGRAIEKLWTNNQDVVEFARLASAMAIVLIVVIPSGVAVAWRYMSVAMQDRTLRVSLGEVFRGTSFGTSWDYAAERSFAQWIRIQYDDGRYIGGYVGEKAHMSLSPAPRDLFIANLRVLDDEGYFSSEGASVAKYPYGGSGVWVNCETAITIEFLSKEPRRLVDKGDSDGTLDDERSEQKME